MKTVRNKKQNPYLALEKDLDHLKKRLIDYQVKRLKRSKAKAEKAIDLFIEAIREVELESIEEERKKRSKSPVTTFHATAS